MKSIRWFDLNLPLSLNKLGGELQKAQYREGLEQGFILSRRNSKEVSGKFIERKVITQSIEDPFGELTEHSRVEYNIVRFSFSSTGKHRLKVINPPRSLKPFINTISDIAGLGFSATTISINPMAWARKIEKTTGKLQVTYMECSGINVANKGTAKVVLNSSEDIRGNLKDIVQGHYHRLNKIKCRAKNKDHSFSLELRDNGSASYSGGTDSYILPILTDAFDDTLS